MAMSEKMKYWISEEGLLLIQCYARDGFTQEMIAAKIGINNSYLTVLKQKHEKLRKVLNESKELTDYKVENALLKSALGYTTKEIKVTIGRSVVNGQEIFMKKETITKQVAPNETACLKWLTNRRPDKWRRNTDTIITDEDTTLEITVKRAGESLKDTELTEVNKSIEVGKNKNQQVKSKTVNEDEWSDLED